MTTLKSHTTEVKRRIDRQEYVLRRVALYGAFILGANFLSYLPAYFNLRAWQVLADMGLSLFGALGAISAYAALRRGHQQRAVSFITAALLTLPFTHWFLGFNLGAMIATSLAVLVMAMAVWSDRWYVWMSVSLLYVGYSLFIIALGPVEPLPPEQSTYLAISDWIAAVIFALLMGYEALRLLPTISIRNRLLLVSINLVLLPTLAVTVTSIIEGLNTSRSQVYNHLSSIAQLKANQIRQWEDALQGALRSASADSSVIAQYNTLTRRGSSEIARETAINALRTRLQDEVAASIYFDEIFLIDQSGQVLISTNAWREGQIVRATTFFAAGLLGEASQPPTYDLTSNRLSVILSRPMLDGNGRTIGVIAGRANLDTLNKIMQEHTGQGESGETYLVGLNRALLTDTRIPLPLTSSRYIRTQGVDESIKFKADGQDIYENYAGELVFGVYRWIPELQVALLAEQSVNEALSAIQRVLLLEGGLALGAVVVAIIVALLLTNSISRPLQELGGAASRIAQGDLQAQANATGDDEISVLAEAFNAMTERLRTIIASLEDTVQQRTQEVQQRSRQMEIVAQIGNVIASIRDTDTLLERVTHLISQELGFYHVGVFLLDEDRQYAVLRAANSEGGQHMLARGHKLRVGQVGLVGYATGNRRARVALDVGEDAAFFDNPDLPHTRSEIALPLISGQNLLGALDVQSTEPNAFDEEDIRILQLLADQLAVAIENATLFAQSQQALEEAQRAYGTLNRQAWQNLLRGTLRGGYRSSSSGLQIIQNPDALPAAAHQAIQQNRLAVVESEAGQHVALPIQIRGLTIGTLETFKPASSGRWAQEELETLQAIVDELSGALDGARLYTETQLRAESERRLSRIANEVRNSLDIEEVLKTAVHQIQTTFALAEVEIRMDSPDEEYS